MPRTASSAPPTIDLKDAIALAKLIYDKSGGSIHPDDLASSMGTTVKSSGFQMKLVAMRGFGLIRTDKRSVTLTASGQAIVAPSSDEEHREMVLTAFNAIPLYRALHEKYRGGYLPEDTFFANTLQRDYKISSEHREKWVESFKQSGRMAGILKDEGGKIRVLQMPSSSLNGGVQMPLPRESDTPPVDSPNAIGPLASHVVPKAMPYLVDSFPVILDGTRSVMVPLEFDREDLDYLNGILELYVKRRESKKS
ncbi:MAG: hypothetical protein LAP85_19425 [Acidobacteriia bacterium]|nr:hypothetical protein [Terriglobia bacterium]